MFCSSLTWNTLEQIVAGSELTEAENERGWVTELAHLCLFHFSFFSHLPALSPLLFF